MNNNLLLASSATLGILMILVIVFGVSLFIAWLVACIMRIQVYTTYKKYNSITTNQNIDAKTNTEFLLKSKQLENVKVEKCGFWRAFFGFNMQGYGNSYSPSKKAIYLRKNIIDKTTITAVGVSSQKVGHAVMDQEKDKKFKILSILRPIYSFAPLFILPIIAVFGILDLIVFKTEGFAFYIGTIISFLLLISSFVCLMISIPVEKKANKIALEALKNSGLYTEDEISGMEIVLNSYIKSYIADFIYAIVELIWEIFKLVARLILSRKN